MKKRVILIICFLILFTISLGVGKYYMSIEEKNGDDMELQKYLGIDETTFDKMTNESENESVKEKVINAMNNNGTYDIQEEIEHNGYVYKIIQINTLEYKTGDDMLYNYYSQDAELKKIFDEQLEVDKIVDVGDARSEFFELTFVIGAPSIKKPEIGEHMVFEKGENFGFIEEFAISALVCYDSNNEIVDVLAFQGASGLNIDIVADAIKWEVFIIDRIDYYYKGNVLYDEPNRVYGEGLCTGIVYDMYIDDNNEITQIVKNRETTDNNYYFLSPPYVDSVHAYKGVYVKNYDLSIREVIEWGMLEETKILLEKYERKDDERYSLIRNRFGKETMTYAGDFLTCLSYATNDGYIVRIGPDTITVDGKEMKVYFSYLEISATEYLELDNDEKKKFVHKNRKPIFVDSEVNPELLKELAEK